MHINNDFKKNNTSRVFCYCCGYISNITEKDLDLSVNCPVCGNKIKR